jgi:hypothetical protein
MDAGPPQEDEVVRIQDGTDQPIGSLVGPEGASMPRTTRLPESLGVPAQMVSLLSHELRTPLTPIVGFAELLLGRGVTAGDEEREMLAAIARNGRRMLRTIENVLALGDPGESGAATEPEPIRLDDLLTLAQHRLSHGTDRVVSRGRVDLAAWVDVEQVGQLLTTLLGEALETGGAHVMVEAFPGPGGTARLAISGEQDDLARELVERLRTPFEASRTSIGPWPTTHEISWTFAALLVEANGLSVHHERRAPHAGSLVLTMPTVAASAADPRSAPVGPDAGVDTAVEAARGLTDAATPDAVVAVLLAAVHRLDGWLVPAGARNEACLTVDVGCGVIEPLLAAATPGSTARRRLQLALPGLVERARDRIDELARPVADEVASTSDRSRLLEEIRSGDSLLILVLDDQGPLGALEQTRGALVEELPHHLRRRDLVVDTGTDEVTVRLAGTPARAGAAIVQRLERVWDRVRPHPVGFWWGIGQVGDTNAATVLDAVRSGLHAQQAGGTARAEQHGQHLEVACMATEGGWTARLEVDAEPVETFARTFEDLARVVQELAAAGSPTPRHVQCRLVVPEPPLTPRN